MEQKMASPMTCNNGTKWEENESATAAEPSSTSNSGITAYSNRRGSNDSSSRNSVHNNGNCSSRDSATNGRPNEHEEEREENGCGKSVQRRHHLCLRRGRQQMPTGSTATLARRCALVLAIMFTQLSSNALLVAGLTCYETVNGKTTIVQNDSWTYCALVPATIVGNELVNGSQFGLGPDNDMMAAYNTAFSMSADEYRILTVCIYERYDFSRFLTIKPDLAVEFAFRCVCNYDLCNSEPTFSAYLSAIKSESFSRR